jgi:hypothetical protein
MNISGATVHRGNDDDKKTFRLLALALGTLAAGSAYAWGDAAIAAWTARNAALVAAVNQPIEAGAPADAAGKAMLYSLDSGGFMYKPTAEETAAMNASGGYVNRIKAACDGLTGELIKNGGKNMPVWAQTAQQQFCVGVTATNAALDDPASKDRCKALASAISNASKAKPGEDPPAVVDSAASLVAAATKLRDLTIYKTRKGKVLGDGGRAFTCD